MKGAMTRPPDFICIGAQKSGTTWLYEQLRRHPGIHIPAKELNVFYKDLPLEAFAGAAAEQIVGDISPVYGAAPGIAAKIARACPRAKLVMLIRNPVERAWSQYKMAVRLGNVPRDVSFVDAFLDDRQWLQRRGRYAEIIGEFSGVGGPMLVLDFARIAAEPRRLLVDVYEFLGLDPVIDDACAAAVFASSRDSDPVSPDAADRAAAYYRPFNARLRDMLPWRPGWLDQ
jgi:hypothetical protein